MKKSKKVRKTPKLRKKVLIKKKITKVKEFSSQEFFKAKIRVIGIGGGGGSIVSEIGRSLGKASFVIADTDVRAFKKRGGIKQFLFGQEMTHGLGTGLNIDLAKAAAESEKEKITKLFEGQDIVIFIACLGGGLGSGASQVFAKIAKDFGGISFGIFTLPFKFEGKNKLAIAQKALRELRASLNVSITIPNERIFKVIEANTAITDAFSMVNKSLIESLESLIDLIYSPGVINIDFADLKAILQGTGNLAFLNTVEASGKDRAEKIVEAVLSNPLYQNNNFTVQKVLFNIASSGNVSMFEVDKISRAIGAHHEGAKTIFGISKEASLKQKIKTTLLMTGPSAGAPAPQKPAEINAKPRRKQTKKKTKKVAAKVVKKALKKLKKKKIIPKKQEKTRAVEGQMVPVFAPSLVPESAAKLVAIEELEKKAIRRNALEIKEAEALEEQKKSQQEKEWEIPAFLRKIKINKVK
ncbi:MAG TPA: cell division protein FtsZ [Negativicutes bacterium]|nr:cell division protein FtsZ [Negativicutes bacterium]